MVANGIRFALENSSFYHFFSSANAFAFVAFLELSYTVTMDLLADHESGDWNHDPLS
jgi:hypothetical protein